MTNTLDFDEHIKKNGQIAYAQLRHISFIHIFSFVMVSFRKYLLIKPRSNSEYKIILWVMFKVLVDVVRVINGTAPVYLKEMCVPARGRYSERSQNETKFHVLDEEHIWQIDTLPSSVKMVEQLTPLSKDCRY
ncbi:hypothetical protein DPMN_028584 [Dreissena polymorpha]|uniref:Uncharacterized protein n=1 Tax=Dreissena polymorpha TaxID=45954 RepID=A0A9D4REP5_DREPO|nr:hypothetical protein DPMN_028584 [Dreissena polymorpha]